MAEFRIYTSLSGRYDDVRWALSDLRGAAHILGLRHA
jgi:hypothetical protein